MSARKPDVAVCTTALSTRLAAVLDVGARMNQVDQSGAETDAGPVRRSNNQRANRAGSRNDARAEERRLLAIQEELDRRQAGLDAERERLMQLERENPQQRLPKAEAKRPTGPPQSQELPRRRPSPARVRPDRPTLGVEREFEVLDEPLVPLTGEQIDRAARDGKTYVQALREDGVDVDNMRIMMSDIIELTDYVKEGSLTNDCFGSGENMRRGDVLFAVEAVRKKLMMDEWPLAAIQTERYEDLCAFEAVIFLAAPHELVTSCLSTGRAKLRQQWGQRELCGWIDTVLLCIRPAEIRPRVVSGLFLTSCNRSHLDIISQSGFAAMGNNISQSFSNSITLSKMFMFVEELLLANTYSGGALRKAKNDFEKKNEPVCMQIERDGKLCYMWTAMLYHLVTGTEIDESVGFVVDKNQTPRYKQYMPTGSHTGEYLWDVYALAKNAWWVDTLLLTTALNLITEENAREFHNASTYARLTATTNVRSCLRAADAETLFGFSKTSSAMKVVWAKTWAITVGASSALAAGAGTAIRTTHTFFTYATLALTSAAYLFGAAPVTTTLAAGTALGTIARWSPTLARYMSEAASTVSAATATATTNAAADMAAATDRIARSTVRNSMGYAARSATARINGAAMAAMAMRGRNITGADPVLNAIGIEEQVVDTLEGHEGIFAAAATFFTSLFSYGTYTGLRRATGHALAIGGRAAMGARQMRPGPYDRPAAPGGAV